MTILHIGYLLIIIDRMLLEISPIHCMCTVQVILCQNVIDPVELGALKMFRCSPPLPLIHLCCPELCRSKCAVLAIKMNTGLISIVSTLTSPHILYAYSMLVANFTSLCKPLKSDRLRNIKKRWDII